MVLKPNCLTLFLLPLLLMTSACGRPAADYSQSIEPKIESVDLGIVVQIDSLRNFSDAGTEKIGQVTELLETVLNSEEFRQGVYDFTWMGKKTFADNDGLNNEQIYARLMAGRETYSNEDDHIMNLDLSLYKPPFYKKWSVVGYGYPGQPRIYLNRYYFNTLPLSGIAGLLAHEWCHKIGFNHDYRRTSKRPYSVPYGVGTLVSKIAEGLRTTETKHVLTERTDE